jgi:hypothetical protein
MTMLACVPTLWAVSATVMAFICGIVVVGKSI